ncbi:MAG: NAD(P)H-dependent glycerol-3-phosphate dehydrogenase [Bacilli bacterium]|nr:NAD(P)H-dependent glycerol-3-phosphate dehydrogenase [Bacilli bacterium]
MNKMNITILGAGAYGIALSSMFLENNCNITMWTKSNEEKEILDKERCNKKVLPDYKISDKITFTTNLEEAISNANVIVIAIPVKYVTNIILEIKKYYKKNQHICIASKGIEQGSCLFIANIIKKHIHTKKICVISGGTFAVDMIKKIPLGLSLASKNKSTIQIMIKNLQNDYLKLIPTTDIFGVEMYGAIKNVIAIASGIIDGMGCPESTKSMFITKALNDIVELIYDMGGNKKTILTYAGIGDLLLTCNSVKSRNYSFGKMIGEKTDKNIIDEYKNNTTIEGLYTLKSIYDLIHNKKKKMPIINIIYDIVYKGKNPKLLEDYLKK